jgi:hypothetical protein
LGQYCINKNYCTVPATNEYVFFLFFLASVSL